MEYILATDIGGYGLSPADANTWRHGRGNPPMLVFVAAETVSVFGNTVGFNCAVHCEIRKTKMMAPFISVLIKYHSRIKMMK